ncbi:MAG: AAA family ATPase [Acidimicrobiia bacterium]|nr:AAA family ATPase [Acidimicrobiia bacterium]NNL69252.1 AAA family ATPase [Acidimicrobiia bacterium]
MTESATPLEAVQPIEGRILTDVVLGLENASIGMVIPSGFQPFDKVLDGGLRTRELVLVGGVPGVGKTIMTLQWARNIAAGGFPVSYVCYEHDEEALASRLLALEVGELKNAEAGVRSGETLALIQEVSLAEKRLGDEVDDDPVLASALETMSRYSDDLVLIKGSGTSTRIAELREIAEASGPGSVLFVDYLQKIPMADGGWTDSERSIRQGEELKELAMEFDVVVVAVTAAEASGLNVRRVRPHHIRGASGLTYEADVICLLNEKWLSVSKRHSAYDPVQAQGFKRRIVMTIEKNRRGKSGVELEFVKDFVHFRFDTKGGFVEEQLIDDMMFPE